jgi:hypothetical protein
MKSDDDIYKVAYQEGPENPTPPDCSQCPSPETLARSFEPGASKRIKRRIVDHLSKCAHCQEEFKFYHELQSFHQGTSLEEKSDPRPDTTERPRPDGRSISRPVWSYVSLFLGLALISSVVLVLFQSTDLSELEREEEPAIILDYPQHSHNISDDLFFRWEELPSAQRYVIELFDDSLLPVWTSPSIQGHQVLLPSQMRSLLKAGRSYYWMVTAFSGPEKVAESKLTLFVIQED